MTTRPVDSLGPVRLRDIDAAQTAVVSIAKRLAIAGKLRMSSANLS
ncbi:MAG: hypothetical protein EXQ91_08185 [Alphaproteobacteria bacterium]|nr:hypothetical protein [Alphaproteobacteria bacterium]